MRRGQVYAHPSAPHRRLLLVSADSLSRAGTALMIELADKPAEGTRGLLSVPLPPEAPLHGAARADRLGYFAAERLGEPLAELDTDTMHAVDMALRVALDLD